MLSKIVATKIEEVSREKIKFSTDYYLSCIKEIKKREFFNAINNNACKSTNSVIAEIKKASPSAGIIRENFSPSEIAISYQKHHASCLSVLTDNEYFQGKIEFLKEVREVVNLPILRKDFIIDKFQIPQSKAMGADAILLIAAILDNHQLKDFYSYAKECDLDILVEVHDEKELENVLLSIDKVEMIGINNRNLKTFKNDLSTSSRLHKYIPKNIVVVSESGITKKEDIQMLNDDGIYSFLIGSHFMSNPNPGKELSDLMGYE
jgi:indole-3-glycerol phosphate synthase